MQDQRESLILHRQRVAGRIQDPVREAEKEVFTSGDGRHEACHREVPKPERGKQEWRMKD